jgi:drug/metabolite transporter (DMT)-like permease
MIASMVIWGISWPSNGALAQFGSAFDLGFFRYLFVVISLLLVLLLMKEKLLIAKKAIPFVVISAGIMAAYNYTFLAGLKHGSPGAGGILVTTLNPVIAYALGMLVDWKKPSKNEALGLTIGVLAGLILLKVWENKNIFAEPGNFYFLLCAILWSVLSKFTSKSANYGSSFAFSWWMYLLTFVFILPFNDFDKIQALLVSNEPKFWGNVLFSSVITTTFATTLYFFATSKIGAEKASSFIFIVPFTAALSSFLIVGEHIQMHTIIGGFLGIGAVYMINKKRK